MENNDLIKEFTDKIIKADDTSDLIKQIIVNKTKDLIQGWKAQKIVEGVFDDSAIKLNGDDILINGKLVGHLKYDLNDMNGGVNFVSADGRMSKEFEGLQDLYGYLMQTFGVKENKMEDLGTKIEDPKKAEFEGKENLAKQDGTEGADPDGKKEADKKSETKGKFEPGGTSAEGSGTPRFNKLKGIIADIKKGKRPTSTAVTENKKNWNMDNADADGNGKLSKIKANTKKIKDIADKQGAKKD